MPPPQGYIFSHDDIRIIRELYFRFGRLQHYTNPFGRPPEDALDHEEFHTTEFHVAHTPEGGIPALTQVTATLGVGDIPGSADCQIFRFNPNGAPEDEAEEITGHILKVYNLSTVPVEGNTWITITRDKYGDWIVSGEATTGVTCFPAELVSTYDDCVGYEAKRMNIRDDGGYDEHLSGFRTTYVYTPDEDKTLQPLTRGWLCPSPDNAIDTGTGTCVGGTGTADDNQRWIFIPVLKWRTTCGSGQLEWQYSIDGGVTWITEEELGVDCGTGTGSDPTAITVGGCGWVSGLRPENCLELLVVETIGRCLCIDDQQELILCWNDQASVWQSGYCTEGTGDDDFLFCGTGATDESGVVLFWIDSGGTPRLSIDGENLVWDKCGVEDATGDLFIDFSGGSINFCGTAEIAECAPSYYTVRIKCTECPTLWYCVVETDGDCTGTGTANERTVLALTAYEAALLGELVCSGPYDTEEEAEVYCQPCECVNDVAILSGTFVFNFRNSAVGGCTYFPADPGHYTEETDSLWNDDESVLTSTLVIGEDTYSLEFYCVSGKTWELLIDGVFAVRATFNDLCLTWQSDDTDGSSIFPNCGNFTVSNAAPE